MERRILCWRMSVGVGAIELTVPEQAWDEEDQRVVEEFIRLALGTLRRIAVKQPQDAPEPRP